jgi:uncharacterized repeat protein (TIGR02543 family)
MATKTTGWLCTHTASVISETETTATIKVECFWKNNGWTYDINYVSAWVYCDGQSKQVKTSGSISAESSTTQAVSCGSATFTISKTKANQAISCYAKITSNSSYVSGTKSSTAASVSVKAKTSYTVKYDANGGTGAPGSQTKWHSEALKLTTAKPSKPGHTFKDWNTAANDSGTAYSSGANYTTNAATTLYAQWAASSYTISYNANGGTGAPSSQTKAQGATVKISSTKPTRDGYTFSGWSNAANSATVLYRPGDNYTANANIALYAVWVVESIEPDITNFSVDRCNSDGTLNESGEYAKVQFDYLFGATDDDILFGIAVYELGSNIKYTGIAEPLEKTSDSISRVLGSETAPLDTEKRYTVKVTLTTVSNPDITAVATLILEEAADSLELMPGNKGIRLPKSVQGNVVGLSDLVDIPANADLNTYTEPGAFAVKSNAIAETVANIPSENPGTFFVSKSLGGDSDTSAYRYRMQFFVPYMTTVPITYRHINKNAEGTWEYGKWKTLSYPTKDIAFTPVSGVTVNRCMLCRNGDIVTMYLSCKVTTAMEAGTQKQIGTIASDRPGASVATVGMQNNSLVACWVQNTGNVMIRPSTAYTANRDIEFNLTWNVAATWS